MTNTSKQERCHYCGYTESDARFYMDHHLCKNAGNAPWEKKSDKYSQPKRKPKMTVNFFIDVNGNEEPIPYKASDLVNKPAPEGYHWELDNRKWKIYQDECTDIQNRLKAKTAGTKEFEEFKEQWKGNIPAYNNETFICVRDKEDAK